MAIQTSNGKAFEFATLNSLHKHLSNNQQIEIVQNNALINAQGFYDSSDVEMKTSMDLAADAASRIILRLEPQLLNPMNNVPLYLCIQEDAAGIAGDVRDIVCIRNQNGWQVGISCKHNHNAVKHSRLSKTIDFGASWLGVKCSQQYFDDIMPLFDTLSIMRNMGMNWSDIPDKEEKFYIPLLSAFADELIKLEKEYSSVVPERLLNYLLGVNDFYKVIAIDSRQATQVQSFNIYGTLNKNAGKNRPIMNIPQLTLPTKIFDIGFKPDSNNTIIISLDNGWSVSMRIHNASTKVEPSLKFDVTLLGVPQNLYSQVEPW